MHIIKTPKIALLFIILGIATGLIIYRSSYLKRFDKYGLQQTRLLSPNSLRPNLIVINTDDQDISTMNVMTEVNNLLAQSGATFTNCFVNVPLCCPSRSSFLRGQYAHNHDVHKNHSPNGGCQQFHASGLESSTLAVWLHNADYKTALMGKYLNGYPGGNTFYTPPGWDDWFCVVGGDEPHALYSNFNYKIDNNGQIVHFGSKPDDYLTDVLAKHALEFINHSQENRQPFFLYIAPWAPHFPAIPAPRHENAFADTTAPKPPSFDEADVSDKPDYIKALHQFTADEVTGMDKLYRQRDQSLLAIDEMVAQIVNALKNTNQLSNTYIIFTSDNGYHIGEHRLLPRKETPYEEDIRVPLIICGPGIAPGKTITQIVGNIDLAPTLAELAGVAVPPFVDGKSFANLLHNKNSNNQPWRDNFLIEHWEDKLNEDKLKPVNSHINAGDPEKGPKLKIPTYKALRTTQYIYVEFETGEKELYDLNKDPFELDNIADHADPALLSQLHNTLVSLSNCKGNNCQ